jgi:putative membrane protein
LANSLAILLATNIVPGFFFRGNMLDLLIAAAVIGLINALVKPIIQLLALPAIFLTLGLFNIFINIFLLLLADKLLDNLTITTFGAAFWSIIIISLTNYFISSLNKSGDLNKF